jgi:hypothetical protein
MDFKKKKNRTIGLIEKPDKKWKLLNPKSTKMALLGLNTT